MAGRPPHAGPYEIRLSFHLTPEPSMPDAGNLEKSTSDALQKIVVVNDKQCRRIVVGYDPEAAEDWAAVEVVAL